MLGGVTRLLGLTRKATLLESLDLPAVDHWVADTGDDRDVSQSVGRMVFAEFVTDEGGAPLTLPRGDVLLFGGDTAYPVATADEIYRRVVQPWNEVLRTLPRDRDRPRVLLGIPGNHDWYDGLDGFGRFFRQAPAEDEEEDVPAKSIDAESLRKPGSARNVGLIARGLHLDELGGTLQTIADAAKATRAMWRGRGLSRRSRLTLDGYEPVQEVELLGAAARAGLDLWGVDRQLGGFDYRQRVYFRRVDAPSAPARASGSSPPIRRWPSVSRGTSASACCARATCHSTTTGSSTSAAICTSTSAASSARRCT